MMGDGLLSYFFKLICDFEGFFFKSVPETSVNPSLGFRSLVVMKLVKKFGVISKKFGVISKKNSEYFCIRV